MEQTRYSNITADGNARQQNGHIYNNTAGHSASGEARQHIGNVTNNTTYTYTLRKQKSDDTLRENGRNETLLTAAAEGQRPRVTYLLARGVDLDWSDDQGFTALHHACLSGFEDVVQILLEAGADLNAQSLDMGTPLCLASMRAREKVVRLLLDYRANVNKAGLWVGTPLHCACCVGSVKVATMLLQRGASLSISSEIQLRILQDGCAVDVAFSDGSRSEPKYIVTCYPFYLAANQGHHALVDLLLEANQSVDSRNRGWRAPSPAVDTFDTAQIRTSGITALMRAAHLGYPQIVATLLAHGADVDLKQSRGYSALSLAATVKGSGGNLGCVRLLVEANADVNSRNNKHRTPLFRAVQSNSLAITRYLLGNGAQVDVSDAEGVTPCILAAEEGHLEVLLVLLEQKPDLDKADYCGNTALHGAVHESHPEIVECLLRAGAKTSDRNNNGRTPLHVAVSSQHVEIARLLLESGATPTIEDEYGKTALDHCELYSELHMLLLSARHASHFHTDLEES